VVAFTDTPTETPVFDLKPDLQDGTIVASTGQLRWYEGDGEPTAGYFTMDTDGTQAVVGFADGQRCRLGDVTIEPQGRFAALYVSAHDKDGTLSADQRLLVVAMARARNTGMRFNAEENQLEERGGPPILLEPVKARLVLRRSGSPRVHLLDHDGRRTGASLPVENGAFAIDGARDRTPYYLIQYD
jgi:hypothetical protein